MKISSNQIKAVIERVLGEIGFDTKTIIAIYLFGSIRANNYRSDSDIDLAFLLDAENSRPDTLADLTPVYLIATRVGMEFDRATDVVVLNTASLETAYQVVTEGKCIIDIDEDQRVAYESTLKGMYFDFRPFLDQVRSKLIAQI